MEVFVVRVVRDPEGDHPPQALRGVVEHPRTGRSTPFRDAEQLLAFMLGSAAEEATPRQRLEPA